MRRTVAQCCSTCDGHALDFFFVGCNGESEGGGAVITATSYLRSDDDLVTFVPGSRDSEALLDSDRLRPAPLPDRVMAAENPTRIVDYSVF